VNDNEMRYRCGSWCSVSDDGDPDFEPPWYTKSEVKKMPFSYPSNSGDFIDMYYCLSCWDHWNYEQGNEEKG
jgi:hypothetical protein